MHGTNLCAIPEFIGSPVVKAGSPVLDGVLLGVLLTTSMIETTLGLDGRDHVGRAQVDLQPLAHAGLDLTLRTPGATCYLLAEPDKQKIREVLVYYFLIIYYQKKYCMPRNL